MKKYTIPAGESAETYATLNGLKGPTWTAICDELGIPLSPTKSGRVALTEHLQRNPDMIADAAPVAAVPAGGANIEQLLANAIAPYIVAPQSANIDENAVIDLIRKHAPVRETKIQVNDMQPVTLPGQVHKDVAKLITLVKSLYSCNMGVWLTGSAGSGKTTAAEQTAKALGKSFYFISVCSQTTKSDLFGYMNASGQYVRTVFRDAYEKGGLFLLDEADAGNANVLAALNSALANGQCAFPDGMVKKHADFFCLAAANTFGTGATQTYVGRNVIDAATLDRFVVLNWDIDEKLEQAISIHSEWTAAVQMSRAQFAMERIIISPRASIAGGALLDAGIDLKDVIQMTVTKGVQADLAGKIEKFFLDYLN